LGQAQSLQQQELARAGALGQLGLGAEEAGLQRQQVLTGLGTGLGAFGAGLPLDIAAQQQQLGLGALQGAFLPQQMGLEALRIGSGLGGSTTTGSVSTPSFGHQVGTGLMEAGVGGLTSAVGGLFDEDKG
jgi:hypothetical protein